MKKMYGIIACSLLVSGKIGATQEEPFPGIMEHVGACPQKLVDSHLVLIDGTSFLNVAHLLEFRSHIEAIFGHTWKTAKHAPRTFVDMVALELEGSLPEAWRKKVFVASTEKFIHIAGPYLDGIKVAKKMMTHLIEEWSEKHQRFDSLLLRWSEQTTGSEEAFLKANLKNLQQFHRFLTDLHTFLGDLIYSCPKSYKMYLQAQQ